MSIALRNKRMMIIALFVLALVTVLVLATTIFSPVTHVDLWHAVINSKLVPDSAYGGM